MSYPYCQVDGIVAPQVQFQLQLPTTSYAQRYAAKAIIASFYGQAPRYSYYDGCSDGGPGSADGGAAVPA